MTQSVVHELLFGFVVLAMIAGFLPHYTPTVQAAPVTSDGLI